MYTLFLSLLQSSSVLRSRCRSFQTVRWPLPVPTYGRSQHAQTYLVLGLSAIAGSVFWLAHTAKQDLLNEDTYIFATVESSRDVPLDRTSKVITLHVPSLDIGVPPIWSLFIKDHDIQIERQFTPISGIDDTSRVRLWVRKYPRSEMSNWLCQLPAGSKIEVRGPVGSRFQLKELQDGTWDHVLMISGGTGITAFAQLLQSVFESEPHRNTYFTLLHGSKSPEQLPPNLVMLPILQRAKDNFVSFRIRLFVDSAAGDQWWMNGIRLSVGQITTTDVTRALELQGHSWSIARTLVLLCGPDGMITAFAGPRSRDGSHTPIRGLLGDMGFSSCNVRIL